MNEDILCVYCNKTIKKEIKFCPYCGKKQPQPDEKTFNKDPYEVLQLNHDAEIEVIEAAFKSLAKKYHPDTNKTNSATKKMQEIIWAYGILKDKQSRRRWDQTYTIKEKKSSTEKVVQQENDENEKKINNKEEKDKDREKVNKENKEEYEQRAMEEHEHWESVKKEISKNNRPNFPLAFAIFSGICLVLYLIAQSNNGRLGNDSDSFGSEIKPFYTETHELFPSNTPYPTITPYPTEKPKLITGDVIAQYNFSSEFPREYSEDKTFFVEGYNGKYIIGIIPRYPDNFRWSYGYTKWGLDDFYNDIQYEFLINLRNRDQFKITKNELNLTAIPIEYGFYIGNIEDNKFVSFSLVELDGKIVGWNIGDNNNLFVRKSTSTLSNQFETCYTDFTSFYNESGLQASRGSLVYQNSLKSNCGFKLLEKEITLFKESMNNPAFVKIVRNLYHVKFYLKDQLLQEIDFPSDFFVYNSQNQNFDKLSLKKTDLNNFGFLLYDYGKEFEIEIDDFKASIP